jgi:hypothetical protein
MNLAEQRLEAHSLLDGLPEEKLVALRNLLALMVEPLSLSLANAPIEDEELTPETMNALNRASETLDRGEYVSHRETGVRHRRDAYR